MHLSYHTLWFPHCEPIYGNNKLVNMAGLTEVYLLYISKYNDQAQVTSMLIKYIEKIPSVIFQCKGKAIIFNAWVFYFNQYLYVSAMRR